jgi:1,4-alpha-glucan branching enzyme
MLLLQFGDIGILEGRMPSIGAFTFVLHSHLPYCRQAGRWPHGEEWLHEAAAETYVPLLNALYRLLAQGVPARMTIGLTPILLEQLADEDVRRNFLTYLDEKIQAASQDVPRFETDGNAHMAYLAGFYRDWYRGIRASFVEQYQGDLVAAFRKLQDSGLIEVVTCGATHGYLPLLDQDASIHLQLRTAVESYKRHFGRAPRAIWLPECAYRPAYVAEDGRTRPGIESFLAEHRLGLFFAETHLIEGGRPVGVAAGEAIGPYGAITRRYLVPFSEITPEQPATTHLPYYVSQPEVAVIGRDNRTGLQVWSADWGYPGDFDYREFHKKDGVSGMQYWRVSGAGVDLADKDAYHPDWAGGKVEGHADHFARLVTDVLQGFHGETGQFGIVSANYDTELFGHWWFEGIDWLEGVLRRLARSDSVELTTASDFLAAHPPETVIHLPEGSWGAGGGHFTWDNADTHWMWPVIHAAERRMRAVTKGRQATSGAERHALDQAARELLLLQSSDWPFLVSTGQAREYAIERFRGHLDRFHELIDGVETGAVDAALTARLWERDKIFPEIDYRWFRE